LLADLPFTVWKRLYIVHFGTGQPLPPLQLKVVVSPNPDGVIVTHPSVSFRGHLIFLLGFASVRAAAVAGISGLPLLEHAERIRLAASAPLAN